MKGHYEEWSNEAIQCKKEMATRSGLAMTVMTIVGCIRFQGANGI